MKQPEWQRGGICGALSSTSQQLNIEPSEQRERERLPRNVELCKRKLPIPHDFNYRVISMNTTELTSEIPELK